MEETLTATLHAETDELCKTRRYGRTAEQATIRAGQCEGALESKAAM
jgi:hypothetical protein